MYIKEGLWVSRLKDCKVIARQTLRNIHLSGLYPEPHTTQVLGRPSSIFFRFLDLISSNFAALSPTETHSTSLESSKTPLDNTAGSYVKQNFLDRFAFIKVTLFQKCLFTRDMVETEVLYGINMLFMEYFL